MAGHTLPITGGCLCGAIRYELSELPIETGTCHCRDCQKSTGSAFMVMARFSRAALRYIKGEPKLYRSSSIKDKGFCSNCGSLLFDRYLVENSETPGRRPDMVWIQIGTLDHPEASSVDWHYGVESQLPWVNFDDGLPQRRCDKDPGMAADFAAAEAGGE